MTNMRIVIDTNVPKTANGDATPQATLACISACVNVIQQLQNGQRSLVIDDGWHILREYQGQLRSSGQPGVGDAFLKWVLTNQANPARCEMVSITPTGDERMFTEFPDLPALANFDPSDRKFVAVALAHPKRPPIINATDTDWRDSHQELADCGVKVNFICPELMDHHHRES